MSAKNGFQPIHPERLTGGVLDTHSRKKTRKPGPRDLPKITFDEGAPNYCKPLAHGWDTFGETYSFLPTAELAARLDAAKAKAEEEGGRAGRDPELIEIGAERFHISPKGGRAGTWLLRNDDMSVDIRKEQDWGISVRYGAAGLWEHGLEALQHRALSLLNGDGFKSLSGDVRVSTAHYAFDFWSPKFTEEMQPEIVRKVVAITRAKRNFRCELDYWGRLNGETLTIGGKTSLQVQVYNKTREITDASGKTWMVDMWERESGIRIEPGSDDWGDVWRVECRFGKTYLRERNITDPRTAKHNLGELVAEAMVTRRLTSPNDDKNRARWPMHPLFTAAYKLRGAPQMLPVGRFVTGRRSELVRRAEGQLAGAARSLAVLKGYGAFDMDNVNDFASALPNKVADDPDHEKKIKRAVERYRFVDEAE